jgi:hypothetical protein
MIMPPPSTTVMLVLEASSSSGRMRSCQSAYVDLLLTAKYAPDGSLMWMASAQT